jgi:tetraacyldisaccharide 4'-kinase
MREPSFWHVRDRRSRASAPTLRLLTTPLAALYAAAGARRIARTTPIDAGLPVICVGNLTLGGAGKTPVASEIRRRLVAAGVRAATLSRGYRGEQTGPLQVDPLTHSARDVGDEPLMLAASGESWIAKDRPAGAHAMKNAGVAAIVMDDGHQNPLLRKSLSLVVIDAVDPFGNGFVFPKGPLREPVAAGLSRADAVVLVGDGDAPSELAAFKRPILRARLAPAPAPQPGLYIAFAGIGRPERFFDSLKANPGVDLADAVPYPDHHAFQSSDLDFLMKLAAERSARLITTHKDHVRLPPSARADIAVAPVEMRFADGAALDALLAPVIAAARA